MIRAAVLCAFGFGFGLALSITLNALAQRCGSAIITQERRKRAASTALAWSGCFVPDNDGDER